MEKLDSSRLKLKRARAHIAALSRSVRHSPRPEHTFREKPTFRDGMKLVEVETDPCLKADVWGPIIGDIAANLRDSLDHITWSLAMLHAQKTGRQLTGDEEAAVKFPLCDKPAAFDNSKRRRGSLEFVLPDAYERIERFQPYNRREWPELEMLRDLRDLSNTDKHRVVTPCYLNSRMNLTGRDAGVTAVINRKGNAFRALMDQGAKLEPDIKDDIVVYPRDYSHPVPIDRLPLIHDFIRDEVVPAFEDFFK